MGALTDLFKSERGLFALALVIAATVLTGLGQMTIDAWQDYSLYVFGIYATGKTMTGVAGLVTTMKRGGSVASAASAATPAAATEPAAAVEPAAAAEPAASTAPAPAAETK